MVDAAHFIKLKSIAESKRGADEEMLEPGHRSAQSQVTGQRGAGSQVSAEPGHRSARSRVTGLHRNAAPPESFLRGNRASQAFPHVCGGAGARQHNPLRINTCTHTCTPALRNE